MILEAEDGLLARIKELTRLKTVQSIASDLNDEELLRRFANAAPGVFVSFGAGAPPAGRSGTTATIDSRWGVFIATTHANKEEARRRGDATAPGMYQLLEVLIKGLHNYTVKDVCTFSLIAVENHFDGQVDKRGLTVFSIVLGAPLDWPGVADASVLAPFQTFGDYWDIPPHETSEEHKKWLQGDETTTKPDAKDVIELAQ